MIPQGNYRARATEAVLAKTSKGREQVAIDFELLNDDVAGQHITWFGYFTDGTFDRTIESLRACGWQGDDLGELGSIAAAGAAGLEVALVVEHEEYEGKTHARVRWVNRSGGVAVKDRMSADESKRFAAQMRARVASSNAGGARPAAPPAGAGRAAAGPAIPADDVPF